MEPYALNVEIIRQVQVISGDKVTITIESERNAQFVVLAISPSDELQNIIHKGLEIHGHGM